MSKSAQAVRAVGMVGLGVMGHPMAANILRSGTAVHITGRSPEKYGDLIEAGAVWHDTAQSLADAVGLIVLMLPDLPQVEEMLAGSDGLLAGNFSDLLVIIASTSSPIEVQELGGRLARETDGKVRVIDAPVSGGSEGAQAGTLSIMVGGDQHDVNDAWPVLAACGNPVHLGPLGSGQVAKACNQMIVAATILALGEAQSSQIEAASTSTSCSSSSQADTPAAAS
jgi:2-hydroxy-3-oxopropionate reductase